MPGESIITQSGIPLLVEKRSTDKGACITFRTETHPRCLLHWGLGHPTHTLWQIPPKSLWPEGSRAFGRTAVQSPFKDQDGSARIIFRLEQKTDLPWLVFALFFPDENRWDNNQGSNYWIDIPSPAIRSSLSPVQMLEQEIAGKRISYEHIHHIEDIYQLAVAVTQNHTAFHITLITDIPGPLTLHWGISKRTPADWSLPPKAIRPPGTTLYGDKAAETPFEDHEGLRQLRLEMTEQDMPAGICFVLRHMDTAHWVKDRGRDFYVPIVSPSRSDAGIDFDTTDPLAETIIEKEMSPNSWTLMHRFNLCYELLDETGGDVEKMALLFVWLRFSAIRQLDWQRNYNTQPRELAHAQDQLTVKLANLYVSQPGQRHIIRLIMPMLGRGGEGQRIRDEILNIMHRHHIKEVSGHFMEEWHQKLHNNTTPDDVVICEAYLSFLRHDGDIDRYFETLEQGGVTRDRLKSYERPIRSHPDFIPHLRDPLIHDFEIFLGILKAVHSGTDLGIAIHSARHVLDPALHDLMDFIWGHRDDGPRQVKTLVEKITEARRRLSKRLQAPVGGVRDLLFLDLALEDFLRIVVERSLHLPLKPNQLVDLIALMLENRSYTDDDEECIQCLRHWRRLLNMPRLGRKWSLQAQAAVERLERVLSGFVDRYYAMLQPKAEFLGNAFHADPWTITLFSEEVVRGRPAFVLVMLLRYLNPILRKRAELGNWQVVSRGQGLGRVEIADDLGSVQRKTYDHSTVIVTDRIAGDEEIPQGITAIITPDTTDIVSHVAIRARNAHVLIATCYDPEILEHLKSLNGQSIKIHVNVAGEVVFEKGAAEAMPPSPKTRTVWTLPDRPAFTAYALPERDFTRKNVGAKSKNLKHLRGDPLEGIRLPGSAALPFGVFEKVLADGANRERAEMYQELSRDIDEVSTESRNELLEKIRQTVLTLKPPGALRPSLYRAMNDAGITLPGNWDPAWMCIKQVWSSKWNERAYLSRRSLGIPHSDLFMAVLIQEVVAADYSFVIHTTNPFTDDKNEIYAEVVLGLGETLVGNYPGRAFGFCRKKRGKTPHILAFPSKSIGLFGAGLIFRSDSNGEDLIDYAGAGLYDSIMATPPHSMILDYAAEPLVWDEDFQKDLCTTISEIGTTIEKAMGSPQDIEGAISQGAYYVVQTRPQVGSGYA